METSTVPITVGVSHADSSAPVSNPNEPLDVCVVSHTHWDREWYHAAPRFRQRLVALVDALLEQPAGEQKPFLLDGQAIVLEDYLLVRPDRATELARRLSLGTVEAGPWYVLADNLIPSGEAIVRNLQAGRKVLAHLGAAAVPIAYCPDTFGHPAALPLIAKGFGLPLAIVWRGFGGQRSPGGDVFRWKCASGDQILIYHLPPDGYETGSALPGNGEAMLARWRQLSSMLRARSTVRVALLPNGADHHALQPDIDAALLFLETIAGGDSVTRVSLCEFASRVLAAAKRTPDLLPVVRGELRDSYGYTWTLGGTLATRAAQKRANAHAERSLIRDVEPWLVLAWFHGSSNEHQVALDGRITLAQIPALLDITWRTLLRAHPHDTLCGCSTDAVARSMNARLESVHTQALGMREAAVDIALQRNSVTARSRPVNASGALLVRNRAVHPRGGVAEVILDYTMGDEPVGPGSRWRPPDVVADMGFMSAAGLQMQRGPTRLVHRRRESPQHYPDNDLVRAHYALVWVPTVPALGLSTFALIAGEALAEKPLVDESPGSKMPQIPQQYMARSISSPKQTVNCVALSNGIDVDNGMVRVHVSPRGVAITANGTTIDDAITLENARDEGDAYTPAIRGDTEVLQLRSYSLKASGPLRGSVVLNWETRSESQKVRVTTTIVLDAESEALRVDVKGENRRRNHRLRLHFRSGILHGGEDTQVWADAAFGAVRRRSLIVTENEQLAEHVVPTMPMHRWLSVCDEVRGVTVHSDGLAEAEVLDSGTVALTLVRSIGQLSRNNLPERPGHAGWPVAIPLAQSQGKFRARVAIHMHGPWSDHVRQQIEIASDSILLPLVGHTIRDLETETDRQVAGPQLQGEALRMSAVTLAADNDGIVLRCINDSDADRHGEWTLPLPGPWEIARARLDETLLEPWRLSDRHVAIRVVAKGVETIRVRRPQRG